MRYHAYWMVVFLACIFWTTGSLGQSLVTLKNNQLVYAPYANEGQTGNVNVIPDFSTAGYGGGGTEIPAVKTVLTVRPGTGDCTQLIQDAIDSVSRMSLDAAGFRGAILLKRGVYRVEGSIRIAASGIVLRGEGNQPNGTVLIAAKKEQHDFITIAGGGRGYGQKKSSMRKITSAYVPTGGAEFTVGPDHDFAAGDSVVIEKTPNDKWIEDVGMAQYGWSANGYNIRYERIISKVEGDKIAVNIPVVDPIEEQYGGGVIFRSDISGRISRCGVESLRIESVFENDEDENHGWNAVVLSRAENCWVRDVVTKYFGYACVNIHSMSVFNTVQDCAMIDPKSITTGRRKYSFNISNGSTGNLIQRCVSWGGRHDYVTGSRVPGPNVFLDCVAENTFADIGPHHRWSTGVLFDNVYGGQIRVQNRKAMGSGHGWAGVQTLFWNCFSAKGDFKVEKPTGAMNWGIGCSGLKQSGEGYWESWGTPVAPRSLYLKQLEERSGMEAVKRITTPEQRTGGIWDSLSRWANQIRKQNKVVAP